MPADEKPPSSAAGPGAPASGPLVVKDAHPGGPERPAGGEADAPGDHPSVPETFLALASHELRTPLQAMGLQVEMLRVRIAQSSGELERVGPDSAPRGQKLWGNETDSQGAHRRGR